MDQLAINVYRNDDTVNVMVEDYEGRVLADVRVSPVSAYDSYAVARAVVIRQALEEALHEQGTN